NCKLRTDRDRSSSLCGADAPARREGQETNRLHRIEPGSTLSAPMPGKLLTAVMLVLGASTLVASDWPRFRGPNGSGVADSVAPTDFGPGRNMDWRTEVPLGRSSPIVAGDRIYLTAADGQKLVTMAVDRASGRILWRREVTAVHARTMYRGNNAAS